MAKAKLKHPKESFDSLFRRFKKSVDKEDTLKDFRKNECFEKPSLKRKRAKASAKKRAEKQQQQSLPPRKNLY